MNITANGPPRASAPAARLSQRSRTLARVIERACDAAGTTPARFGREAAGNPSLVLQLYSGHAMEADTRARVLARLRRLRTAAAAVAAARVASAAGAPTAAPGDELALLGHAFGRLAAGDRAMVLRQAFDLAGLLPAGALQ